SLSERIREIHARSRDSYGARRIYLDLRDEDVRVGRKRVERLMRAAGLSGYVKRRKFRTTFGVPGVRVADDLVERAFNPPAPNRLWASDIKHVSTWEGTLYLTSVIDCFSRKVVGWSMRSDMQAELVVDALEMAISRRQPADELVHHSDQGSQYVALIFGQKLRKAVGPFFVQIEVNPARRPSLPGVEAGAGDAEHPTEQRDRVVGLLRR